MRGQQLPTYNEWNGALHSYFLRGVPVGSTIYLETSDDTIDKIGYLSFDKVPDNGWSKDFLHSVKSRLVKDESLNLTVLKSYDGTRLDSLPFLATLVLVASRMESVGDIHESNYFSRLNRALGTRQFNNQNRRPRGMESGSKSEEPLWLEWGRMLRRRGFMPTARPGEGARRYINYAISQTLLRATDRRKLYEIFGQANWPSDLDGETLASLLRARRELTEKLRRLLQRTGPDAENIEHALEETYNVWLDTGGLKREGSTPSPSRSSLNCGLHRSLHFRTGTPLYQLLPRQPRGENVSLSVLIGDVSTELVPERPGYYYPVDAGVDANMLGSGASFPVMGHSGIKRVVFPRRSVWVLKNDPFDVGSYASLGRPGVGEHFVLLVEKRLGDDVERAADQGLLKYKSKQTVDAFGDDWIEYNEMLVVANQFSEANDISSELRNAVRPTGIFTLSTKGGLALLGRKGWLVSFPPSVSLNSYFSEVEFSVSQDDIVIQTELVIADPASDLELDIDWMGVGGYEITARAKGQEQRILVNLIDWDDLPEPNWSDLGSQQLRLTPTTSLVGPRLVLEQS